MRFLDGITETRKAELRAQLRAIWTHDSTAIEGKEGVFDKIVADHGTVMWPDGSDLCPDEVYDRSVSV